VLVLFRQVGLRVVHDEEEGTSEGEEGSEVGKSVLAYQMSIYAHLLSHILFKRSEILLVRGFINHLGQLFILFFDLSRDHIYE